MKNAILMLTLLGSCLTAQPSHAGPKAVHNQDLGKCKLKPLIDQIRTYGRSASETDSTPANAACKKLRSLRDASDDESCSGIAISAQLAEAEFVCEQRPWSTSSLSRKRAGK
jgi:hypothetical protein